jgi:hypothetical protein
MGLLDQQQLGDGGSGAAEELQPDDVLPLTRTQLQAKVSLAACGKTASQLGSSEHALCCVHVWHACSMVVSSCA